MGIQLSSCICSCREAEEEELADWSQSATLVDPEAETCTVRQASLSSPSCSQPHLNSVSSTEYNDDVVTTLLPPSTDKSALLPSTCNPLQTDLESNQSISGDEELKQEPQCLSKKARRRSCKHKRKKSRPTLDTPPRKPDFRPSGKTHKIPEGEIKKQLPSSWICHSMFPMPQFILTPVPGNHPDYLQVFLSFRETLADRNVESIHRIENPFLWSMYLLKKEDNVKLYGSCSEMLLFHATKSINVESICQDGFDWRRYGTNVGHKFGMGVSFSSSAAYASFYSDKLRSGNQMFLVRVLLSMASQGTKSTVLPPVSCDTTEGNKGKVWVKYEDYTYYPEFLISFSGKRK